MGHVYWDESKMHYADEVPDVLAFGDSWFWYLHNNLLNPVNRFSGQPTILCFGANGMRATQLASGFLFEQFKLAVKGYESASMVMLSAGGNDFAGFENLQKVLLPDCSQASMPEACFKEGMPEQLFDVVRQAYEKIILGALAYRKDIKILVHCYDYAIPTGIGYLGLGQSLKVPMDACRVPEPDDLSPDSFRCRLVKHLINAMAKMLDSLVQEFPQVVIRVPSAGTLHADEWANELHPTPKGFDRLGQVCFSPIVRRILEGTER